MISVLRDVKKIGKKIIHIKNVENIDTKAFDLPSQGKKNQ